MHERYRQTDRQTGDKRQTDEFAIAKTRTQRI